MMKTSTYILTLGLIGMTTVIGSVVGQSARVQTAIYDRAVNQTLDTCLAVGSEWSAQRYKFTWQQLQTEVAHRMNVKRVEPWTHR